MKHITKLELEEYTKSKNDIFYFINKYVKIKNKHNLLESIVLSEETKECIDKYRLGSNFVSSGNIHTKNELAIVFLLHFILFSKNTNAAIMCNDTISARKMLDKFIEIHSNLPAFLMLDIKVNNKIVCVFENGCSVYINTANSDSFRGRFFSLVFVEESEAITDYNSILEMIYNQLGSSPNMLFTISKYITNGMEI